MSFKTSKIKSTLLAAAFLSATSAVMAQPLSVQIGAFSKIPTLNVLKVETLSAYGAVYLAESVEGYTRVSVGKFDEIKAARLTLQSLQSSGYPDAFVTKLSYDARQLDAQAGTVLDDAFSSDAASDTGLGLGLGLGLGSAQGTAKATQFSGKRSAYDDLSEQEKSLAVMLDGELRIKLGDLFLTLDEYRAR